MYLTQVESLGEQWESNRNRDGQANSAHSARRMRTAKTRAAGVATDLRSVRSGNGQLGAVISMRGMMKMGRVALITGASRGIGAATALVLAERGFRVVVNYRSSAEQADEVVRAVTAAGGEAVAIRADVTEADDVAAMVGETEQRWGESTCSCTTP